MIGAGGKDILHAVGNGYELRPYVRDLARGLMTKSRHVLTRFDFGDKDWIVRDATFVSVRGSVFLMRPMFDGGLLVKELDILGFENAVRRTVDEIPEGDTAV